MSEKGDALPRGIGRMMQGALRGLYGFVLAPLFLGIGAAQAGGLDQDILGVWQTAHGHSYIRIYDKDGGYFGQSVVHPTDSVQQARAAGQPQILAHFLSQRPGVWSHGTIYDPDNKTHFQGILTLLSPDRLKVYGYVGLQWLGGETIWTKVHGREGKWSPYGQDG